MKRGQVVRGLLTILLLLALGALPGCGEKEQTQSKPATVSKEEVKKEAKEAYDATKAYTQEQMQAFREQTDTKLTEYKNKIDQLQAEAEKLGGDAKTKAEQQLTALRQKQDQVSAKLKQIARARSNRSAEASPRMSMGLPQLQNSGRKASKACNVSSSSGAGSWP